MMIMSRPYIYKGYKLHVGRTCVIVEDSRGFTRVYYFTSRMKGKTKESVVRFLNRIKAI